MTLPTHQAFPVPNSPMGDDGDTGMNMREYYAGLAMQGLLTNATSDPRLAAKLAVQIADALIEELNVKINV